VATSADGQRSHLLGVDIVDRELVREYVQNLQTGDVTTVPLAPGDYHYGRGEDPQLVGFNDVGLGAHFPRGTNNSLGDRWTWQVLLRVDGVLIDSCVADI
jgi:hypothetical protein